MSLGFLGNREIFVLRLATALLSARHGWAMLDPYHHSEYPSPSSDLLSWILCIRECIPRLQHTQSVAQTLPRVCQIIWNDDTGNLERERVLGQDKIF